MDVDLRKLRYFVAVADELNFSRAADRLHIAQPVLSRQIRALETELRAELFVRDRRRTELTAAGEQLLLDARPLLAAAEATRRRVARAARGRAFTVGFMPGLTVTAPVRALAAAHPELIIDVVRTSWADQVEVLHDGRVDVGFVRLPVDPAGLRVVPLFAKPRVAALPSSHPLAGKESVALSDLAAEHLLQHPDAVPEWRSVALELRRRRPIAPDAAARTVEEKLERVAAGQGISVLPLSTARYYQRGDVSYVGIDDIGPTEVAVAWVSARRSPLLAEFAELAVAQSTVDSAPAG